MCWKLSSASAATWPSSIAASWSRRAHWKNCVPAWKRKLPLRSPPLVRRMRLAHPLLLPAKGSPSSRFSCASSAARAAPIRNFRGWADLLSRNPRPVRRHRPRPLAAFRKFHAYASRTHASRCTRIYVPGLRHGRLYGLHCHRFHSAVFRFLPKSGLASPAALARVPVLAIRPRNGQRLHRECGFIQPAALPAHLSFLFSDSHRLRLARSPHIDGVPLAAGHGHRNRLGLAAPFPAGRRSTAAVCNLQYFSGPHAFHLGGALARATTRSRNPRRAISFHGHRLSIHRAAHPPFWQPLPSARAVARRRPGPAHRAADATGPGGPGDRALPARRICTRSRFVRAVQRIYAGGSVAAERAFARAIFGRKSKRSGSAHRHARRQAENSPRLEYSRRFRRDFRRRRKGNSLSFAQRPHAVYAGDAVGRAPDFPLDAREGG